MIWGHWQGPGNCPAASVPQTSGWGTYEPGRRQPGQGALTPASGALLESEVVSRATRIIQHQVGNQVI